MVTLNVVFKVPFFSLNWCNFEKKEKLCILSNCNILENECIHINMYKFYQNIPKKTTNSKSISKKKPFQIQNFPNLTQPSAKMIWSSRRDATMHGFWPWINGQSRHQSSLIRTQLKKTFPPWAFHTKTFASHPRIGWWLSCMLGLSPPAFSLARLAWRCTLKT